MVECGPSCSSISSHRSRLAKELRAVPILHSLGEIYHNTKQSNRVINTGLALVESTCCSALDAFANTSMGTMQYLLVIASKLDDKAGDYFAGLKEQYPGLNARPEEIREMATMKIRSGVKKVMRTRPAQKLMDGLDWAIDGSEKLLRRMKPRDPSPRKKSRTSARLLHKDHSYASEDSGACEGSDVKRVDREQQTKVSFVKKGPARKDMLARLYHLTVVIPLEAVVLTLKGIRRFLYPHSRRRRGHKVNGKLSPEKEAQISARRKVSPRKRAGKPTLISRLKSTAYSFLGVKDPYARKINLNEVSFEEAASPGEHASDDRKRKHDEVVTDQGSEGSDADLQDFDWENYDSGEDPDYNPEEDSDAISEDISDEGETESDLEPEEVREQGVTKHLQIKEKTDKGKQKEKKDQESDKSSKEKEKNAKEADVKADKKTDVPVAKQQPVTNGKPEETDKNSNVDKAPQANGEEQIVLQPKWKKEW